MQKSEPKFVTVRTFASRHDWPSAPAIRHLIFTNKDGFADRCIRRIGKRVLVDEAAVIAWIDEVGSVDTAA